jgi:hypothetical protein
MSTNSFLPLIFGQLNQPKFSTSPNAKLANTFVFLQSNGAKRTEQTIKDQKHAYQLAFNAIISNNTQQAGLMLQLATLDNTNFAKIAALSNDNGVEDPADGPLRGISAFDLAALSAKGATSTIYDIAADDFTAAGVTTTSKSFTKDEVKALGNGQALPPASTNNNNDLLKTILLLSLLGGQGGAGGLGGGQNPLLLLLLLGGQGGLGNIFNSPAPAPSTPILW